MARRDANEKTRDSNNYNAQEISVITIITYLNKELLVYNGLIVYVLVIKFQLILPPYINEFFENCRHYPDSI